MYKHVQNQCLALALPVLLTLNFQPSAARAQGTAFTYQGELQNNGGPASGTYQLAFTLFASSTGGAAVAGPVTNSAVGVTNGLFTVTIDFGAAVWNGAINWLQIGVASNGVGSFTTLVPRQEVTPAPYAITAVNFSGVLSENQLPNFQSPDYATVAGGSGNTANTVGATVGGGFDNSATLNYYTTVAGGVGNKVDTYSGTIGGGYYNTNSGSFAVIGGGAANFVSGEYATVGGGKENAASGGGSFVGGGGYDGTSMAGNKANAGAATIGGGLQNLISSSATYGFIGGGLQNSVSGEIATVSGGSGNGASGTAGTVGGGEYNDASGNGTTVSGGFINNASGNSATVSGGEGNVVSSDYATAAGGFGNTISGAGSFIGGGGYDGYTSQGNTIDANAATIGGGLSNNIPDGSRYAFIGGGASNTASAFYATVGGGVQNTADGEWATVSGGIDIIAHGAYATVAGGNDNSADGAGAAVGGGAFNVATGANATVPGGELNYAAGDHSFAGGYNSTANYAGTFAWSDDTGTLTQDTGKNQFVVRASGGFFFYTGTGSSGAHLDTAATSWTTLCDRNAKKNFQPVDTVAVLDKLAAIPIEQWNYQWEKDDEVPNIGPMAQDFKAAFYPGRDDKGITTLEFDGVELAAIQGLNRKLAEKDAQLQRQAAQISELNARLEKLEQFLERRGPATNSTSVRRAVKL